MPCVRRRTRVTDFQDELGRDNGHAESGAGVSPGDAHLKRILTAHLQYYHESRCHLALDRNSPVPRQVEAPARGAMISIPQIGGLHHRYVRRVA